MPKPHEVAYPAYLTVEGQSLYGTELRALADAICDGQDPSHWPAKVGAVRRSDRRMGDALQWLRKAGVIRWDTSSGRGRWVGAA